MDNRIEEKEIIEEEIEELQTTFNEDGLDVLVEDGTAENITAVGEEVEAPEGIGADGFTMRTWKPYDNKNYITQSSGGWSTCIKGYPTDSQANVLANCVGYASGRFNEIINIARDSSGCPYSTLNCNAENFVERAQAVGLAIGNTPRRGAIMCWQKGSLSSGDGAGHVAIVERVDSNNQVYTSESAYSGTAFYNSLRTNNNGRWGMGSSYSFRCFIYLPDDVQRKIDGGQPTPTDKITEDGKWGKATTRKAQQVFGTPIDGFVSNQYQKYQSQNPGLLSSTFMWVSNPKSGSNLIAAIQRKIGVNPDGFIGPNTIRAMQNWLGTPADGKVSNPSTMVRAFQRWLNQQ